MKTPAIGPVPGGGSLLIAWRLKGQPVLVIGGGSEGANRVYSSLDADATVTVVSPELGAELQARYARGEIEWIPRGFQASDVNGMALVLMAVMDRSLAEEVARICGKERIPLNVADIPAFCDFWFPSIHRSGPIQIAVSTNGVAPGLAGKIRELIAHRLPEHLGDAVQNYSQLRQKIRNIDGRTVSQRMVWLRKFLHRRSLRTLSGMTEVDVAETVEAFRGERCGNKPREVPDRSDGLIQLVGAGPGDPSLLTVAALEALGRADLVLADRLVSSEILGLIEGEVRIAKKQPGRADQAQRELYDWGIAALLAGKRVVRLKCGDPFLFGRGGEEVAFFRSHGFEAEVIPGISSALSAPLSAGIPVTMRGVADRVFVGTGQGQHGSEPDLPAYSKDTTLVLLMAVGRLSTLAVQLKDKGYPLDLPVAIIERATTIHQRVIRSTLSDLSAVVSMEEVISPATIVLGAVAGLSLDEVADTLEVAAR